MISRTYAKLYPTFWTGTTGRDLRAAGPEATVVALYLISNNHASPLGFYYLPLTLLAHETGLSVAGAEAALAAVEATGFASYSAADEAVWVPSMARFQILDTHDRLKPSDKRLAAVRRMFAESHRCPFQDQFLAMYGASMGLVERLPAAEKPLPCPSQAPSKPSRQEQEQEQQQEQRGAPTEAPSLLPIELTPEDVRVLWNESAVLHGWAQAGPLSSARQRSARARLKEHPDRATWVRALEQAGRSPFLLGQVPGRDGTSFRPDLAWLLQGDTISRILEGRYDDREQHVAPQGEEPRDATGAVLA